MDAYVDLAYGRGHLRVPRRPDSTVVLPRDAPPLADPAAELRRALRDPLGTPPLSQLARSASSVAVSVCDGTRAQPRREVLPVLLAEIDSVSPGIPVTVLVATGTHRGNTPDELAEMLGADVLARCEVVNHDARDDGSLVDLGVVGDGVPLYLNRRWLEAGLRVTTGFVEPHFFAGFSGGPKMVAPGLAGLASVMVLHDVRRIGDPLATWGVVEDNPVHRDIRACAAVAPPHLALDVLIDRSKQITHVFAGELFAMHEAACATAKSIAMRAVDDPFDVVVTTNAGYPLDQNLYQCVKGIAAAARVVREGGTIIVAAECADGLPDHGPFAELLASAGSPAALLAMLHEPGVGTPDQWQVQVLASLLTRARVLVHSGGLTDQQVAAAHMTRVPDLEAAITTAMEEAGDRARLCYLPEGPQTIPYLAGAAVPA